MCACLSVYFWKGAPRLWSYVHLKNTFMKLNDQSSTRLKCFLNNMWYRGDISDSEGRTMPPPSGMTLDWLQTLSHVNQDSQQKICPCWRNSDPIYGTKIKSFKYCNGYMCWKMIEYSVMQKFKQEKHFCGFPLTHIMQVDYKYRFLQTEQHVILPIVSKNIQELWKTLRTSGVRCFMVFLVLHKRWHIKLVARLNRTLISTITTKISIVCNTLSQILKTWGSYKGIT